MDPIAKLRTDCNNVFRRALEARGFTTQDVIETANTRDDRPLDLQAAIALAMREVDAFASQQFEERSLAKTLETNN